MKIENFIPHDDKVFVIELEKGPQKKGNIIIPDDVGTLNGQRNRWAQVIKVGKNITDIKVGEWVLVEKGRWTTGIDVEINNENTKFWYIDYPSAILLVSDEKPKDIGQIKL